MKTVKVSYSSGKDEVERVITGCYNNRDKARQVVMAGMSLLKPMLGGDLESAKRLAMAQVQQMVSGIDAASNASEVDEAFTSMLDVRAGYALLKACFTQDLVDDLEMGNVPCNVGEVL